MKLLDIIDDFTSVNRVEDEEQCQEYDLVIDKIMIKDNIEQVPQQKA